AKTALDSETNKRKVIFATLKPLSTRVVNALKATEALRQTVADAQTVNIKIQGNRRPVGATLPKEGKRTYSVIQQSFASLTDNFAKLIEIVSAEAFYEPKEQNLQVTD